jgi:acetyltransferase-like isoleucine patch superfamily enzyme
MEKLLELYGRIDKNPEMKKKFLDLLVKTLELKPNAYHPMVFIKGSPEIGKNVYIGLFSEVNSTGSSVRIGDNCDIASFVSINAADSHKKCIGTCDRIERTPVTLERNVFVGSHSFIGGPTHIGHHSVVGAGTILLKGGRIPPYSLIVGNPATVKKGYFLKKKSRK